VSTQLCAVFYRFIILTQPLQPTRFSIFVFAEACFVTKFYISFFSRQGWQVSAKHGLNRGLNWFKPFWQKQVSASF